ncbi:chorismate mutase 2-like isoform X1 [Vicia villosa]|uniref:chorismate mutase 2-like isoform X1 n=2 Tax=Vicia villosa TaxID=3911 RepID=UPI00273B8A94|nr:chorismate mutase 2-like isoform X1 [Vicia villosa]
MFRFLVVVAVITMLVSCTVTHRMAKANEYTLESVRASLIQQEDTIIFSLIERARFPLNSPTYQQNYSSVLNFSGSLFDFILHQTEDIQAKTGRYMNPEENPYQENLSPSIIPHYNFSKFLHHAAASININKNIRKIYFNDILPLFIASGDDGNYAQTAANDLTVLQAISKRIHYGKFVAETKFRKSPRDYKPLIRVKDREALMKLLVDKRVEKMVLKRVEKKAMVFGQEVSLDPNVKGKYKVDPSIVYSLYKKWIIPMTKDVEVEYLLRRLD